MVIQWLQCLLQVLSLAQNLNYLQKKTPLPLRNLQIGQFKVIISKKYKKPSHDNTVLLSVSSTEPELNLISTEDDSITTSESIEI